MPATSQLVNATRQKDTLTDNGAVTNSTSLNNIVDLFFIAGASRRMSEKDIEKMLLKSWTEDQLLTLKLIFWAGNIRGGAGERRFFRIALKWLEKNYDKALNKNIDLVPHYNRWDSLFHLDFNKYSHLIVENLEKKNGLLAKWLPRKKQHDHLAYKVQKSLGINPKQYRKLIVSLSKTVEQQMCAKEWKEIEYSHVPSVAMNKYRKAFLKNDKDRFSQFILKVKKGEEKINASVIFPYDLYNAVMRGEDKNAIEAQWHAMPNYMEGTDEKILPVCDVSGSMAGLPMSISVSLGLYLSERNESIFKDAFVTFSGNPKMEYLKGSVVERMHQLERAHWDGNTDLSKVFKLILSKAIDSNVSPDEMPTMILIISDMEFDNCASLTNYENIVRQYEESGYKIPKIVFWNVNGRIGNVPVSAKQKNVALVSGATPAVVKGVLSAKSYTPIDIVKKTLNNKVYDLVKI